MLRTSARLACLVVLTAAPLRAQIGLASAGLSVSLTATRMPSIGVSLPAGAAANLSGSLEPGPNDFAPFPIATTWDVDPAETVAVSLVAYFESPAAALAGPVAIPASAVFGRVAPGAPVGRTDGMQVRIDLSGWHHLPAGTYRGTLNLLAITE